MKVPTRLLKNIDSEDIRRSPDTFFMVDRCGFFVCNKGHATLSFFNRSYEVSVGSLTLFHPFVKVAFSQFSEDLNGYWGEVDLSQAIPMVNQVLSVENIETIRSEPVVYLKESVFHELHDKIQYYLNECDKIEREFLATEICRPICLGLLKARNETLMLDILNQYYLAKSVSVLHTRNHDLVFQNFMIDLQKNFMYHRDTMFYAERSLLSPKYFSAVIKEVSGAAPSEWIIRTVIAVAQKYLKETTMTINEISALLNFPTQAFFCKYFKRYTSLSPKEYRNS